MEEAVRNNVQSLKATLEEDVKSLEEELRKEFRDKFSEMRVYVDSQF